MSESEAPSLPIAQLESLKFKANQIIESIYGLQRTIEAGNQNAMPAWPDILTKYNILLSQTHTFSNSLVTPVISGALSRANGATDNPYAQIALHPSISMSDTQLDNEVIPLLRNQQTTDVLRMENDTVRRLSDHMATRGSLGVLGGVIPPSHNPSIIPKKPEYEDVLQECEQIRTAHDQRVERAVRAVTMLREKFDWKQRVEVEVEEPEELEWDPRMGMPPAPSDVHGGDQDGDVGMDSPDSPDSEDSHEGEGEEGSGDEDEVEGELQMVESFVAPAHVSDSPETPGLFAFGSASVTVTSGLIDVSMP